MTSRLSSNELRDSRTASRGSRNTTARRPAQVRGWAVVAVTGLAIGVLANVGCSGHADLESYCDSTGCYTCDGYGCSSTGSSPSTDASPPNNQPDARDPTPNDASIPPKDGGQPDVTAPVDAGPAEEDAGPKNCSTDDQCGGTTATPKKCLDGYCRYTCTTDDYCRTIDSRIGHCAADGVCRAPQ